MNDFYGAALTPYVLEVEAAPTALAPASSIIADPVVYCERLTTFPPNALGMAGFFGADTLEIAANNARALVLGALGTTFVAEQEVVVGHAHDTEAARLKWRQLGSALFFNNGAAAIGAAPDECYDALKINQTSETDLAWMRLWVSGQEARAVIPRIRISHAVLADVVGLWLYFYGLNGTLVAFRNVEFDATAIRSRAWLDLDAVRLGTATPDARIPNRYPLRVKVACYVLDAADACALHEIAFGVAP